MADPALRPYRGQGVTCQVGQFITTVDTTSVPGLARSRAALVLLDTIGCMVGGWSAAEAGPLATLLAGRASGQGGLVTGAQFSPTPEIAAIANGTLGAALHFDDVARLMGGHPSAPVAAAIIAGSGQGAISGTDALLAYTTGVEISVRVGHALGPGHGARGWHTTATAGVFGATAAVCHLRRLDAVTCASALGMAASFASGLKASFKTMTRSVHSGWAAHSGMLAADLAVAGMTGPRDALEAGNGFLALFGGAEADPARVLDRLGAPWVFVAPGDGLKIFPCHGATHRALDAALEIRSRENLDPGEIVSIRCYNPPPWFTWLPRLVPASGEEGRFSMEYILAAAFHDGAITQQTFTDAAVARPQVRAMFDRIELHEDARFRPADPYHGDPDRPPYEGYVRVEVTTADGQTYAHEVEYPPGAPGSDLDPATVEAKFLDCAVSLGGVSPDSAGSCVEAFRSIDKVGDFGRLVSTLGVTR
jgi:2-methylcitrate dehydratase PrpD